MISCPAISSIDRAIWELRAITAMRSVKLGIANRMGKVVIARKIITSPAVSVEGLFCFRKRRTTNVTANTELIISKKMNIGDPE